MGKIYRYLLGSGWCDKHGTYENEYLTDAGGLLLIYGIDSVEVPETDEAYIRAVKSNLSRPVFKLYLLNYDETIREDITERVISEVSATDNYQSGKRRTVSLTIDNNDGEFSPNPVKGKMWKGVKFRLDIGIYVKNYAYLCEYGIYSPTSIDEGYNGKSQTVQLQMSDKYAMLDGEIGGKTGSQINVSLGENIYEYISDLLKTPRINTQPLDVKPIKYPYSCRNIVTPYTYSQSPNSSVGAMIQALADMGGFEYSYDKCGNLYFNEIGNVMRRNQGGSAWRFNDGDVTYMPTSKKTDFSKVYNVITVAGCVINGYLFDYTAKNTNPRSPSNIYVTEPNELYISDENIASDELARERAEYELFTQSLLSVSTNVSTTLIPHLSAGDVIEIFDETRGFNGDEFIINSINVSIGTGGSSMSLNLSNVNEVSYSA